MGPDVPITIAQSNVALLGNSARDTTRADESLAIHRPVLIAKRALARRGHGYWPHPPTGAPWSLARNPEEALSSAVCLRRRRESAEQ